MARKSISKGVRFDVFERNSFTCAYCGRKPPDATLEVDHILPVSKGGSNDMSNLITSCFDCNRGKAAKIIKCSNKTQKIINERIEQANAMAIWQSKVTIMLNKQAEFLFDHWSCIFDNVYVLDANCKSRIKKLLRQFTVDEITDAMEISADYYIEDFDNVSGLEWDNAIDRIGGICYNKKREG